MVEVEYKASVHMEFAKRMRLACDGNQIVPAMNDGRLTWIQHHLKGEGINVSLQTVMRWYHGDAYPRLPRMRALAKVLRVDQSWLALGATLQIDKDELKKTPLTVSGAVSAVFGFVQLAGWQCAWAEGDHGAAHFYSIIKGRQHAFHVTIGIPTANGKEMIFPVPRGFEKCVVLALVSSGATSADVWHMPLETLKRNVERGGGAYQVKAAREGRKLKLPRATLNPLTGFDEALV